MKSNFFLLIKITREGNWVPNKIPSCINSALVKSWKPTLVFSTFYTQVPKNVQSQFFLGKGPFIYYVSTCSHKLYLHYILQPVCQKSLVAPSVCIMTKIMVAVSSCGLTRRPPWALLIRPRPTPRRQPTCQESIMFQKLEQEPAFWLSRWIFRQSWPPIHQLL
jgi:hypothetical protein